MAIRLPDGATVFIATGYSVAKTISEITNANPGVLTSAAHGLSTGDYLELKTGWQKISERVWRAGTTTANAIPLLGADTSDVLRFPAGSSGGTLRAITAWTQVPQILDVQTQGGDQQFWTGSFLEDDFDRQLPTTTSAQSITLGIGDDPTLPGYQALKVAGERREIRALRINLPDGSVILYNGYVSFNETPTLTKGQVMQVTATFSLQGRPVRYSV